MKQYNLLKGRNSIGDGPLTRFLPSCSSGDVMSTGREQARSCSLGNTIPPLLKSARGHFVSERTLRNFWDKLAGRYSKRRACVLCCRLDGASVIGASTRVDTASVVSRGSCIPCCRHADDVESLLRQPRLDDAQRMARPNFASCGPRIYLRSIQR